MASKRVILDTNLWSSIGDEQVSREFDELMRSRSGSASFTRWQRDLGGDCAPRPNSESAEVVAEIRRVRPQWLRSRPDTAKVASLNNFWTNRIWREAVEDSDHLHHYQAQHTAKNDHIVATQKQQRALFIRDKANLRPPPRLAAGT